MNATTPTVAPPNLDGLPSDIRTTIEAAFFGFAAGAILFGITVRQVYQYYTTCSSDPISRKAIVGFDA
ncbi:hypothetical protein D9619_009060 [Psilocybe cf. subviscida]|uniref:Uncharacterized protein n=1 Tax=Psilocybe cf. subviscida TaxID=2480587 RepID=A0A8H5BV08_9AGAR|nr:hypothetical protein D9619_009060 [Psilocybe cf. subviscida]